MIDLEELYEAYEEAWKSLTRYQRWYIEIMGSSLSELQYGAHQILEQLREDYEN